MTLCRVNLILFEPHELAAPLPRSDRRARHILEVLRRGVGESFDAGVVDGPRGKATLTHIADEALAFSFAATVPPPPAEPITLIIGLPRPQTARDILRDATTLGVGAIHFVVTEKSDPNYARATLWTSGEWHRHVVDGAQQAFDTRLPIVRWDRPLNETLAALPAPVVRFALDHYEAGAGLGACQLATGSSVALALGPERGWSARDRDTLRAHGFTLVHLGTRVLRLETAVAAALALVRTKMGRL